MQEAYQFIPVSDAILLVRWQREPSREEAKQFVKDVRRRFDEAAQPLYILSDLRKGFITDANALRDLTTLMSHKNYAGGTAFSGSFSAGIFVSLYNRLAWRKKKSSDIWDTAEEAIAYLESLQPGLTEGIDWDTILNEQAGEQATGS